MFSDPVLKIIPLKKKDTFFLNLRKNKFEESPFDILLGLDKYPTSANESIIAH